MPQDSRRRAGITTFLNCQKSKATRFFGQTPLRRLTKTIKPFFVFNSSCLSVLHPCACFKAALNIYDSPDLSPDGDTTLLLAFSPKRFHVAQENLKLFRAVIDMKRA